MSSTPNTVEGLDGGLPRGLVVLLGGASAIVIVAGAKAFAAPIGPVLLALMIMVAVSPIHGALTRRGAPRWLALMGLLAASFGVLVAIIGSLLWAASELVGLITSDEYTSQLTSAQDDLADLLTRFGIGGDDLQSLGDQLDLGAVAGGLTSALSGVFGLLSALSLLILTMFFMALDTGRFSRNMARVADERSDIIEAFRQFAHSTRSYFIVSTVFGLIVAVLDVTVLWLLGIPLALVWGLLSLITNYIPNVGFVIGVIPPALLAFFEGGWQLAVWVIVAYSAINVVIQTFVQPKFVGDAVGLSATLTFLSLIFWNWVLGPLGALLAVPMSLLVKALLIDIDPSTRWAGPLISLAEPDGHEEASR